MKLKDKTYKFRHQKKKKIERRHVQCLAHCKHFINSNIVISKFHHHDCSGNRIFSMKAEEIWARLEQNVLRRGKPRAT